MNLTKTRTKFQRFDVRDSLSRGEQPLPDILKRVESLGMDEGLIVVAPFLPSPLIRLLGEQGFQSRSVQSGPTEWNVFFWRKSSEDE